MCTNTNINFFPQLKEMKLEMTEKFCMHMWVKRWPILNWWFSWGFYLFSILMSIGANVNTHKTCNTRVYILSLSHIYRHEIDHTVNQFYTWNWTAFHAFPNFPPHTYISTQLHKQPKFSLCSSVHGALTTTHIEARAIPLFLCLVCWMCYVKE